MNILFCGDEHAEDGVLIATFSLGLFFKDPPLANMKTLFTPFAMLRLYADELPFLPARLLYLDDDVIIRRDITAFYQQDLTHIELVGVLDFWGRFFFHNFRQQKVLDYLNSGVLLINLAEIKRTGLFKKVRQLVQTKKMLLPDQAALNKLATKKRIAPRRYNEQYRLLSDTVIQHFTTSFRFWPYLHTLTVKPWEVNRIQEVLHLHEYDDLLRAYLNMLPFLYIH